MTNFARLFTSSKPRSSSSKPRTPPKFGSLDSYKRTYGDKDGQTVFDAQQIKAKRRGKKR